VEWESRLNRVRVATRDGDFDLHWDEREELLALLRGTPHRGLRAPSTGSWRSSRRGLSS